MNAEQKKSAKAWVMRVFEDRIEMDRDGLPTILIRRFVASPETRKAGLTKAPDGFRYVDTFSVASFVVLYGQTILDNDELYGGDMSDVETLQSLIDLDRQEGYGWADWLQEFREGQL